MNQRYNIATIPPDEVGNRAIRMSEKIAEYGSFFVLDGEALHPHISLYHIGFDAKDIPEVIVRVSDALAGIKPFDLKQGPYRAGNSGWIDVGYEKDAAIIDLHASVIAAAKELRAEKGKEMERDDWEGLSEARRQNLLFCGWSEAFDLFAPHLTFSRLKESDEGILDRLPADDFSFLVDRIGLFELGEHGVCTKLIHEFVLG